MREKKETFKNVFNKKRIVAVLILLVLTLVMMFSNPEFQKFLSRPDSVSVSFQPGMNYYAVNYGKEMLIVGKEGVRSIDSRGREVFSLVNNITEPGVMVKNDFIMLADMGGNQSYLYKNDKLISQIKTEREILAAKLNKNGYIAISSSELGYKGVVSVFDKSGKELFKWHSGSGYIGDIDISSKNELAAAQLMTDKEKVYSKIMLVDISGKEEAKCIAEVDGIVLKLKYKNGGGLIAVTDEKVYVFKKNGKQQFVIDFDGKTPVECNIENENNMVFAFDSGTNNTILESYSSRGKLRGRLETDGEIKTFDVNGECILAVTINGVYRFSPSGKQKGKIEAGQDIKKIKIFAGRDEFLSLGSASADIIKIK